MRKALLVSLCSALIDKERIRTTEAKAKEIRPLVEKLITKGKNDTLANRRLVISRLQSARLGMKTMRLANDKYKDRNGGYTRIIKIRSRRSDASKMAIIELV